MFKQWKIVIIVQYDQRWDILFCEIELNAWSKSFVNLQIYLIFNRYPQINVPWKKTWDREI